METVTGWTWERLVGAPDWLAEAVEHVRGERARQGMLGAELELWSLSPPWGGEALVIRNVQEAGGVRAVGIALHLEGEAGWGQAVEAIATRWPGVYIVQVMSFNPEHPLPFAIELHTIPVPVRQLRVSE